MEAESITQMWKKCQNIEENKNEITDKTNGGGTVIQFSEEYLNLLAECRTKIENSKPDITVLYYFPEAAVIYENLCLSSAELFELAKNNVADLQEFDRLCHEMNKNLCEWEILQKNIAQFQLKRVNYSYRILIAIIIGLILSFSTFVETSGRYSFSPLFHYFKNYLPKLAARVN